MFSIKLVVRFSPHRSGFFVCEIISVVQRITAKCLGFSSLSALLSTCTLCIGLTQNKNLVVTEFQSTDDYKTESADDNLSTNFCTVPTSTWSKETGSYLTIQYSTLVHSAIASCLSLQLVIYFFTLWSGSWPIRSSSSVILCAVEEERYK